MKDIAPEITRRRLLIEGYYTVDVNKATVESYLLELASHLDLKVYEKPVVNSPDGTVKDENQGYDAFIPLMESGISLYVRTPARFFSVIIFSCKEFGTDEAVRYTREFFKAIKWAYQPF